MHTFKGRFLHSSMLVGNDVFMWGGHDLPLVHDSPKKRQLTSLVETFNPLTSKLEERQTIGSPPNAPSCYSCINICDDIYYFGGQCKHDDCYHNNLFILDTNTDKWREVIISSDNRPMPKAFCGMISFSSDGKDHLLVVGGIGPFPARASAHSSYAPYPKRTDPPLCLTNEVHLMCPSSSPGRWRVPSSRGDHFPPCAGFTLNTLPGNEAILFGGGTVDERGMRHRTNNVFIISPTKTSVKFHILVRPSDPTVQWPKGRSFHASAVISSISSDDDVKRPHLLVLGGSDNDGKDIHDCWVMDVLSRNWEQISLPESVTKRSHHSITSFSVSRNCVWLLITGGATSAESDLTFAIVGPNAVMMVELVFSPANGKWSVSNVMNSEDLRKRNQYREQLLDHESESRKERHTIIPEESPDTGSRGEEQVCDQIQQIQTELSTLQRERDELCARLQEKQDEINELQDHLESRPWVLEEEEVILTDEKIGGGAYGEVRVAVFRGTRVAAKCLHQLIVSDYNRGLFTREMEISSRIHHPNIVQFVGATRINNPILLYELMATSLHKKLQEDGPLTHPQIVDVCCNIALALCYLHQWRPSPIIHRDVSSPNVLMEPLANGRWRSKLSDFGSANLQLHVNTVIPGNPAYSSPEARDPQYHSPAMDIYSFGILTTEMILHRPPEMDITQHERQVRRIDWRPMKVLLLNCINSDRTQRPTSFQLLTEVKDVE